MDVCPKPTKLLRDLIIHIQRIRLIVWPPGIIRGRTELAGLKLDLMMLSRRMGGFLLHGNRCLHSLPVSITNLPIGPLDGRQVRIKIGPITFIKTQLGGRSGAHVLRRVATQNKEVKVIRQSDT